MRSFIAFCVAVLAAIALALNTAAQILPANNVSFEQQSNNNQQASETDDEAIGCSLSSGFVTLRVIATDSSETPVKNLVAKDFKVYENGTEQQLKFFASKLPSHLVLILDASAFAHDNIREARYACISFIEQLDAEDQVEILSFDEEVHKLSEFTTDRKLLRKAIENIKPGRGSKLYAAVNKATSDLRNAQANIPIIILCTAGIDKGSLKATYEGSIRKAEKLHIPVYAIQHDARGGTSTENLKANDYMNDIAWKTVGSGYRANSYLTFKDTFARISAELKAQYLIGYYTTDLKYDGTYREIRVDVARGGIVTRTIPGYYAPKPESQK